MHQTFRWIPSMHLVLTGFAGFAGFARLFCFRLSSAVVIRIIWGFSRVSLFMLRFVDVRLTLEPAECTNLVVLVTLSLSTKLSTARAGIDDYFLFFGRHDGMFLYWYCYDD
ncbi:hypothetical protein GGR51DRAFT_527373 [Nemania sp. FL0031]|nr:hypothetical protein GGR51DRAFT_527373 [Nemania sp. FL0031]